jgi:hypothetical protein
VPQASRLNLAFVEDECREWRCGSVWCQFLEIGRQVDAGDVEIAEGGVSEETVESVQVPEVGGCAM